MNTTSILNALSCDNVPKVQHENELANSQVNGSVQNSVLLPGNVAADGCRVQSTGRCVACDKLKAEAHKFMNGEYICSECINEPGINDVYSVEDDLSFLDDENYGIENQD